MTVTPEQQRSAFVDLVAKDLVGPANGESEVLSSRPSDRYLTGILFSQNAEKAAEEVRIAADDQRDEAGDEDAVDVPVAMPGGGRPISMGVSVRTNGATLKVSGSGAYYRRRWEDSSGALVDKELDRKKERWIRAPCAFAQDLPLQEGLFQYPVRSAKGEVSGLRWWVRTLPVNGAKQVTVVLENTAPPAASRVEAEERAFFQASFSIVATSGSQLLPRPPHGDGASDADAASNMLIYRNVEEFAVGHTCSATWERDTEGLMKVTATWMPQQRVLSMSADGHPYFAKESARVTGLPDGAFAAAKLAKAKGAALTAHLEVITTAWRQWISDRRTDVPKLPLEHQAQAQLHLNNAEATAKRIDAAIALLAAVPEAETAFRSAQEAMERQRQWGEGKPLIWRPFQIAFQLLSLSGVVNDADSDGRATDERRTMDLLWFPTGGGKTEAYLGLVAFTLLYRRMASANPDSGAGVGAIMRYTLRLLTVQQFERAAKLICALELLRRGNKSKLGSVPFSIGLWVGQGATPNTVEEARGSSEALKRASQLLKCPACNCQLDWDPLRPDGDFVVRCTHEKCALPADLRADLPIYTIDDLVYSARPSLLIGTVDKFAQVVRSSNVSGLLGVGGRPPDLILQDELHLISGPLGTVVGLYEAAIDRICWRNGVPPKVIGSTATIRRAEEQVRELFDRAVAQFPPPGLDWDDSCFAVAAPDVPGRVYVGVTTTGRSPKFSLQATCAALLQRAAESGVFTTDAERDPYWTLLAYFNSIRELGGAHVMMLDDVNASISMYASTHSASPREKITEPEELTSRVSSADIPLILERLMEKLPRQKVPVVLATNMISVGVDIPRLGLMVVNGQPKSMAEYIQATSRVGRNKVPGLIFTVYNAGRPRDRAHFESFRTWHQAMYREVEATSVTPFAPRARDRALHAVVVAIARHLIPGFGDKDDAALTAARRAQLEQLVSAIAERVGRTEPVERDETMDEVNRFIDNWAQRGRVRYWNDYKPSESLLVSAEHAADVKASSGAWTHAAVPTPNSMREVEPSVRFRLTELLAKGANNGSQS